jgi:UMF1 family MFS transporter
MEMDVQYRKAKRSWALYDWANSAFVTTIQAGFMPLYFAAMAVAAGLTDQQATSAWGYVSSLALILIAVMAPALGYLADRTGSKKLLLSVFAVIGALASITLFVTQGDMYVVAGAIYIVANIGFAAANIFYNALLPHVAKDDEIDQVSTMGYALGYLGGGLLFAVNAFMAISPETFGLPSVGLATRVSFVMVGLWWLLFTIPLWRNVHEPVIEGHVTVSFGKALSEGFRELANTFRNIRLYSEAFKLLLAFWVYNDGIGTIIKMAVIYGSEIGIGDSDLILALLLVQFIGFPMTFGYGWLAKKIGTKTSILLGLGVYTFISIMGFFLAAPWQFWTLAVLVGFVQGGTQALSRSMFGAMIPKNRTGEFFGFFSMSDKFAGIVGPLVFGLAGTLTGSSRFGIVSLIVFFIGGGLLLLRVNPEKGMQEAKQPVVIG